MSDARDELLTLIADAKTPPNWRIGSLVAEHDLNVVIDTILANPDVVLRALGGARVNNNALLARVEALTLCELWAIPQPRTGAVARYGRTVGHTENTRPI